MYLVLKLVLAVGVRLDCARLGYSVSLRRILKAIADFPPVGRCPCDAIKRAHHLLALNMWLGVLPMESSVCIVC